MSFLACHSSHLLVRFSFAWWVVVGALVVMTLCIIYSGWGLWREY